MNGINKLGLGTVQWGLPYGVDNQHGTTTPETVTTLLNEARHYGIEVLDTASLYGKSEAVLGTNSLEGFKVVTKTPALRYLTFQTLKSISLARHSNNHWICLNAKKSMHS